MTSDEAAEIQTSKAYGPQCTHAASRPQSSAVFPCLETLSPSNTVHSVVLQILPWLSSGYGGCCKSD